MIRGIISFTVFALLFSACASYSNVTSKPETASSARPQTDNPCVNLNTATAEELTALEGIGEVIAHRIIAYRERSGPFRRKEDILIIEGLSEKKYRAIAAKICVA